MIGTQSTADNVIGQLGNKRFMIFWYTEGVGWVVRGKKSVEKTVESAFADETNIANLHGTIQSRRTRLPQGMTVRRILGCKMSAKDVVVGHW